MYDWNSFQIAKGPRFLKKIEKINDFLNLIRKIRTDK